MPNKYLAGGFRQFPNVAIGDHLETMFSYVVSEGRLVLVDAPDGPVPENARELMSWTPLTSVLDFPLSLRIPRYTTALRPAAGVVGRVIYNTSVPALQMDDGAAWQDLAPRTEARIVHGNVMISAPIGAQNPNVISLAPINGGGLLVKDPTTNAWKFVDFAGGPNSIEGDRTNCYLDGVAGQTLANNTFYYVGIKFVAGVAVMNFTTFEPLFKTADTFITVFGNDTYTTLVGQVYTLNNSFIFDPTTGRSVVSNHFPGGVNQFGLNTPQTSKTSNSAAYAKLDATGGLDLHLVTGTSRLFWSNVIGYASNDTAGQSCTMQVRAYRADGGLNGSGNESIMTGTVNQPLSSILAQPFAAGYYRFEIWVKVSGGIGTFVLQNVALALSA